MKWTVEYDTPVVVVEGECYIMGSNFIDDRFVGYIYHYGKLDN